MLKIKKISTMALLISAVISQGVLADKKFDDEASYTLGYAAAKSFFQGVIAEHKDVVNYSNDRILAGVKDALNGKQDLTDEQIKSVLDEIASKVKSVQAEKVKASNEKLISEFSKKKGVKKTASGLLYRIEKEGEGNPIKATDMVKVHYTGKFADGTVFDTSLNRDPVEFKLDQVIKGWTEGLQLAKKGSKIELVIPADLAYGDQDNGPIPANSTLHFEVEILDVVTGK
ncbi:FKBP-type peptidyl prolyl cis-trans isomerase /apo-metallochaperone SlyD [Bisgaardia hudsonensis]|uniref:Peptidyl-prolyl cis-trans isomerase n=1 Tax=Bisgaardia hudsonensis TaxID=109472 RepID=A0A4R2MT76_9PAST|nr:FKBP-type peptidyl-prolyl cis-trans isomerase [Bisgaardia hudsonensis]QLB12141.1 peptidylprolyl isomerase [Bisgaardia hudsonensis]TCP11500.1 FKBP-type peptidyl prolyl cis-trans isomerase /apo-metallochaperone SlyD [Bisgaardia hudsonensis]